jgi:hypothetical protein
VFLGAFTLAGALGLAGVATLVVAVLVFAQQEPPRLPPGVRGEFDIPYAGTDNPRQRLDLVLPERAATNGPLPVIVLIHGGGWQNGDKRSGAPQAVPLVRTGRYAAVSIGYRLSGEATWPAQIHDCKAAIRWIRANVEKCNLDHERIGVVKNIQPEGLCRGILETAPLPCENGGSDDKVFREEPSLASDLSGTRPAFKPSRCGNGVAAGADSSRCRRPRQKTDGGRPADRCNGLSHWLL